MAGSPLNSSTIPNLMIPGLFAVQAQTKTYEVAFPKVFVTKKSRRQQEWILDTVGPGTATVFEEGSLIPTSATMGESYRKTFFHRKLGLAIVITREAIDDNLYSDQFKASGESLRKGFIAAQETMAAEIFNYAFDLGRPIYDSQPLASTEHPIEVGGTIANTFGPGTNEPDYVALTTTSAEAAVINIRQFRGPDGIFSNMPQANIVVSNDNMFNAQRLLLSPYNPSTANNDMNPLFAENGILENKTVIMNYITLPFFWGIKTKCEDAFIHFERAPLTMSYYNESGTLNVSFLAWMRLSFGVNNWRGMFLSYVNSGN